MSELTHSFLKQYVPLRMRFILAEYSDMENIVLVGHSKTLHGISGYLADLPDTEGVRWFYCALEDKTREDLFPFGAPLDGVDYRSAAKWLVVQVDPQTPSSHALPEQVARIKNKHRVNLFDGLRLDGQCCLGDGDTVTPDDLPGLVVEGIQRFFSSPPPVGKFWGYDTRRMVWLEAAKEAADYQVRHLRNALCFEDRFELLNFAMSRVTLDPGLYMEFGVYKGETISHIAQRTDCTVYGFDSFKGLPENWDQLMPKGAFYSFGKGPTDIPDNVRLVKGLFRDTIAPFLRKEKDLCAFVHIDCDLYSSAKDIFNELRDRIVPGTVLVFDEYFNFPNWREHEFSAFAEFIEASGLSYEYIGYVACGCQVAVLIGE